ncbi:peptidase M16 family protein [Actinotalea fermentans]|uniref:insulinase family protein n=1 Tax=Actinotalea fermentans TaxID=43671 RepID=UPI00051F4012|nr:insulinase family protein [Actinotalea fermentans]KGM17353.1 hypothetical protein N867_05220 [Actinotalea fermentans ATCC 43279 = JCM 9966 = DSM 3133]
MDTRSGEFVETEVSGIRTLHVPAPGCTRMTLHIGAGWADESFVTRGMTHAIEHLVMGAAEPGRLESNACVTPFQTAFWANGPADRVGRFLGQVAAALRDLPLDRLARERNVLEAETHGHTYGAHEVLLKSRFGNAGPGLGMFPGLGSLGLEPEVVARHHAQWFVAGNAVLTVVGPMPEDLDLRLPPGQAPARSFGSWSAGPAWDRADVSDPCASIEGRDAPAASLAIRATAGALERRLRHELGIVYGVVPDLIRLPGTGRVVLQLTTRSAPGAEAEVATALIEELEHRGQVGVTADELAEDLEWSAALADDLDTVASHVQLQAERLLAGQPAVQQADARARVAAVTAEEVTSALRESLPTAMLLVPRDCTAPAGLPLVPTCAAVPAFTTPRLRRRLRSGLPAGAELGFADDVVQYRDEDGDVHEVRFDECVGVGVARDGRLLFGRRGCFVWVDPREFRGAEAVVQAIDERVPAELRFALS